LTHLLSESQCDTLVAVGDCKSDLLDNVKEWLGTTVIELPHMPKIDYPMIGKVLVEGKMHASSVPLVAQIDNFEQHVLRNKKLLPRSPVMLPMTSHWLMDACTSECVIFESGKPNCITVDSLLLPLLLNACESGSIDVTCLDSVVFDIPQAGDSRLVVDLKTRLEALKAKAIYGRLVVPEFGPIADLIPIEGIKDLRSVMGLKDFKISVGHKDCLRVADVSGPESPSIVYCNRPISSTDATDSEGYFQTCIPAVVNDDIVSETRRQRWVKKKTMQPDWRVRQVPISVYHKKRGFKGQIYYTTKHKGWSFYRSRYYN
jgi:hypothetical protein